MALALYSQKFWFPSGAIAPGVVARVFLHSTNTLAPLWTDASGTVAQANPLVTDTSGFLTFWIEEGTYWLHLDTESFEITVPPATGPFATVAQLQAHETDTTAVHGIADTGALVVTTDPRLSDARTPAGAAGGDLTGTYPDPGVAAVAGVAVSGVPAAGDVLTATGPLAAAWNPPAAGNPEWVFDVTDYGAAGDAQVAGDGAMGPGSAVLSSVTAGFVPGDVGKAVSVKGAAPTGVTTLATVIASWQSPTQVTLAAVNSSGGALTGAVVIWGTSDQGAIQSAVDAAETYLSDHTYAQVYFPPRAFVLAGPLNTSKSGNGQIVFGVYPTTAVKRILEFRGETDGAAAVRHWQQTVPQFAGSCLVSFGVYASVAAQIADINANGNPGVICGPNEGSGYGAGAVFSNVQAVLNNLAVLTAHSAYGLTYGGANLWGCANAHIGNLGYGTAGTVAAPSTDYTSPGVFGTGLSIGLLLPAPGNNDHSVARNISCGGGYTYALFLTEHTVIERYMALYCWAGLCPVGNYFGSVGSVHAMKVLSASIEACTHELYVIGAGSSGVGPIIDIDQLSTESGTPNVSGNSAGALAAAVGRVKLTGLFNEAGVSVSSPTGIELVNGQVYAAVRRTTGAFAVSPLDRTLICDTSGAGFTATLPPADVNPVRYTFHNVGPNLLTVATGSAQTITLTVTPGAVSVNVAAGVTLSLAALFDGSAWGWYAV